MKIARSLASIVTAVVGSLGILASPAANAQVATYTPTAEFWRSAVAAVGGTYYTETFEDTVLHPYVQSIYGPQVQIAVPTVFGLSWLSPVVHAVVVGEDTVTIDFSRPMIAFGANFDLAGPGGPGSNVSLRLVDGSVTTFSLANWLLNSEEGNFSGVVSVMPFTSVVLSEGTGCCQETFEMDNMKFATPVPEPETYAMLLAGLGLMGFVARRRRKSAAA